MTINAFAQFGFFLILLLALSKPLGEYLGRVFERERTFLDPVVRPLERGLYRLAGIAPDDRMDWKAYTWAILLFNALGLTFLFLLLKFQNLLPLNPQRAPGMPALLAWNTAVSFVTNTNWQAYAGETALSHLSQMLGLTVQNFLSAATGITVVVALSRGIRRRKATNLGSFWVDLTRATLYILLPLATLLARRPSSSWAPTAADSSTPTPPIPSRTPRP
jgi:K+-transporting ATPase ATPase A chain